MFSNQINLCNHLFLYMWSNIVQFKPQIFNLSQSRDLDKKEKI